MYRLDFKVVIFNKKFKFFRICEIASERICTICDNFEETKQIVEFVQAINHFFKSVIFKSKFFNYEKITYFF